MVDIVWLYRDIGRKFHEMGAERVIAMKAIKKDMEDIELEMDIAISGCLDQQLFMKCAEENWPYLKVNILLLDQLTGDLPEYDQDGIIL